MGLDTYFFFTLGFGIAVFIYARNASAAAKRFEFKVEKKEYKRQKMLARIAGRFNEFEIIDKFEDEDEDED